MNLSWLSGHEVSQAAALLNHLSGSAQRDAGVGVKLASTAWVQNWGSWRALGAGGHWPCGWVVTAGSRPTCFGCCRGLERH